MAADQAIQPIDALAFARAWAPSDETLQRAFWRDMIAFSLASGTAGRETFLKLSQDTLRTVKSGSPALMETPALRMLARYVEFLTKQDHTQEEEVKIEKALKEYRQEHV